MRLNRLIPKVEGAHLFMKKDLSLLKLPGDKLNPIQINVSDIFYTVSNIEAIGHCLYTLFLYCFSWLRPLFC